MQLPIQIDRGSGTSLQAQLAGQLRQLILGGQIKSGAALPGSREMASNLKLSRNTVLLSYDRLAVEGLLEPRAAKGTFVRARLGEGYAASLAGAVDTIQERALVQCPGDVPAARPSSAEQAHLRLPIDFSYGKQSVDTFPTQAWRRLILRKLGQAGSSFAQHDNPSGLPDLRQAIADHLGPARGLAVHRDQVIIVSGVREALNVICRSFSVARMPVVVENPTSRSACQIFESYSARIVPVPVDREGLVTDRLPRRPTSFAYVTPSHQFPTGGTLSRPRRLRLLEWAEQTGACIIEDDHDSDFCYDDPPITSLAGMTRSENVIHVGSFARSIGGGVRIGYLIVPPGMMEAAIAAKTILNNEQSWLDQAVLAEFIRGGAYAKHLRRIQRIYRARREVLLDALERYFGPVDIGGQQGGMHVLWYLPSGWPAIHRIEREARSRGVGVYSPRSGLAVEYGSNSCIDGALIMGYSSISETLVKVGIRKIAEIIFGLTK